LATVQSGETRISIDPSLDRALGGANDLRLGYASADEQTQMLPHHVGALGTALGVSDVLVARPASSSAIVLERYHIEDRQATRTATATVALSAGNRLPPAIDALVAGRSVTIDANTAVALDVPEGEEASNTGSLIGPMLSIGAGTVLVATAAIGAATASGCVERDAARDVCTAENRPNWVAVGIVGGAGLLAIAVGLVWLAVPSGGETTEVGVGPSGVVVRGRF
jgi:hypothetical protein